MGPKKHVNEKAEAAKERKAAAKVSSTQGAEPGSRDCRCSCGSAPEVHAVGCLEHEALGENCSIANSMFWSGRLVNEAAWFVHV
jgi:hypothetical protein